jgi:O-antigen ligase
MLVLVLAGLIPLLITPGILFHYDITPKIIVLVFAAAIALMRPAAVGGGLAALWNRRSGRWFCGVAAAQAVWLAVCTAVSTRPWFSLLGAGWRRMGLLTMLAMIVCIVLVAANVCLKSELTATFLRATAVAAAIASLYGIAQYFDIDPLQPASAYQAHAGDSVIVRPPGTLGHADYFGWWLAVALFCAAALTGSWRWVGRASALLCGIAILLSGTRSAMLGVVAGFVALLFLRGFKFGVRVVVAGALLIVSLAGFYFSPAGLRVRARVQWSASEPLGGARPLLWRDSVRMIARRPLTGFGPETFGAEFPRYQSTDLARLLPNFYQESPHNTAIDALTSEGIPGLVLVALWLLPGGYAAWNARGKYPALGAALVASAVTAMFSAVTCGPLLATGLVIGVLVATVPEDRRPRLKIRSAPILAVSILLSLCFVVYGVMLMASDFTLARFQSDSGPESWRLVTHTEMPGAGEDLYGSRRLAETCGKDPVCLELAIDAATRATRSADSPSNAWYNLAILTAARNQPAPVEAALRKSVALGPNWFKPHWALAGLLAITGRRPEALTEAERALFLDAGQDAEVAQTAAQLRAKTP